MMPAGDELRFDWRRGGAAAGGLIAALVLVVMVILVALSNDARERALEDERRAYNVALLVRGVDSSMSRAEAALGRFMLDEDIEKSGSIYYSQWRLAGHQINQLERLVRASPEQRRRVNELLQLYANRGAELAPAARAAATQQGQDAISWYYAAGKAPTGEDVTRKLDEIAKAEQQSLRERIEQSQIFSAQADRLTDYLSWLGIIVGLGAIFLGLVAIQAVRQNAATRRQAESESARAEALEQRRRAHPGVQAPTKAARRSRRAATRRSAVAAGSEDGGGRPAAAHCPRLQQHAGVGGRWNRSRPTR